MKVTAIKTEKVLPQSTTLLDFLDRNLKKFPENAILAVSAKIISLCEGRCVPFTADKEKLIQEETDYYLPKKLSILIKPFPIQIALLLPFWAVRKFPIR